MSEKMRNIKLIVEYEGTNYVGWQRQQNGKSIQGEIESVLNRILREEVNVIGAGRTDAGVHARGQTANFRTSIDRSLDEIRNGLNGLLPDDIVIHEIEEVPLEFHARYNAKERHYSYLISREPTALFRNYSWQLNYKLDLSLLEKSADGLRGEHDFESFCKANSEVDHHRCNVIESAWVSDGSFLRFNIAADRFLHGMVRALVGTMIDVARGYMSFEAYLDIFGKKNRSEAGTAAPAKGLTLEKIIY
ncbi:MAG: tRNA pseudouridine(38-40) synthase TruA [Chlorobiaceae bacterium]|nr:tRNA pseudouridine(38-40) synthase TruA [Chlorobiaceae bacterium]